MRPMSLSQTIAFVGAGNMASALIEGILASSLAAPVQLRASDPSADARARLAQRHGIRVTADNAEAVADADLVVLAVKPQAFGQVLPALAPALKPGTLVLSIAAGIPTATIETALSIEGRGPVRVVRAMPNTPALVQAGATGVAPGAHATDGDMAVARAIFDSVGTTVTVPEASIDAVTGVSGSGPAYVFHMVEGMVAGGVAAGLTQQDALQLAAQTVFGAGKLLLSGEATPAELRTRVTSKGGTTAAGLAVLEQRGFAEALEACVLAAAARGKELAKLGN